MTQESPKTDYLKGLFSQLPQTKLPGTFRSDLMRKIQFEAARQHRREEHLSLIATILASLLLYYWQEKPVDEIGYRLSVFQPSYTMARSLSIYIGTLALLLLLADHLIRKALRGKKGKLR